MLTAQFVLTEQCNLNCSYCYVIQKDNIMTKEIFNKHYKNLQSMNQEYTFDFFGGEPLLAWEEIKYITKILNKDKLCTSKRLYSNGLLLNQDKVNFIKENNIEFYLSFDGLWEDINRPLKNGEYSIEKYKEKKDLFKQITNYTTVMVHPNNLNLVDNYNYLIDEFQLIANFKIIKDNNIWTEKNIKIFHKEFKKLCNRYSEILITKNQNCMPDLIWNYLYKLKNGLIDNISVDNCGAGSNTLCFHPNKKIYPCEKFATKNIEKINKYFFEECNTCSLNKVCEKGCLYENILNKGPLKNICELYHIIYDEIIILNNKLKKYPIWKDIMFKLLSEKKESL